jgi:hypothetical protein
VCRNLILLFLLLSLFPHASSAQSNQDGRFDHVDDGQGNQVTAGSVADGNRYHSDYFDFTYSLPDGFVDETEQFKSRIQALPGPGPHPDPGSFVLLHAEKRPNESAAPVGEITLTVDALSRYPKGITEKDFVHRTVKAMADAGDAVLQEGEHLDVSGTNFFRADYKTNGNPISGYLTVMVTFRKDFALLWQFSAHSTKEVDAIISSMPRKLIAK